MEAVGESWFLRRGPAASAGHPGRCPYARSAASAGWSYPDSYERASEWRPRIAMHTVAGMHDTYPAQVDVEYPDRPLNRLTTGLRIFTIIPIAIVLGTVSGETWSWYGG